MGKQHTTTKVITAGVIGAAGFMFAGPLQASAKTVTVKSGDTVWKLANRYGVSVSSIEKANHLSKDAIFAGQKVVLGGSATAANTSATPAKSVKSAQAVKTVKSVKSVKPVNNGTASKQSAVKTPKKSYVNQNTQTATKTKKVTPKTKVAKRHVSSFKATGSTSTYRVKSGDTLHRISAKYGVTVSQLQALNHLRGDVIYAGQRLKVKGTASKVKATKVKRVAKVKRTTVKRSKQTVASATKSAASKTGTSKVKRTAVKTPKAKKTVKADAAATPVKSVTGYAVKLASEKIPYVWGGSSLRGMDCSGFTSYVYAHTVGTALPHNSVAQESHVSTHSVGKAVPGDILFWGHKGASYHVAIYIGNNQYVAAPEPGENVKIQSINPYFRPSFAGTVNR